MTAPRATEQSRVEELLRSHETFVEDLFDALLDALGFPQAVVPSSRRQRSRDGQ
ncbi:hypothetical protein OG440_23225 [Streptomyces sp. NBC_00637]|uniref:hypothetical protein n=1 Tax=Streptomyces sp. NBC_00637 TaxID=2903667 RepID=UPI0032522BFA